MSTLAWIGLPVIALAAGGWWWRSRRTGAAPAPVAPRRESAAQAGAEASASDGGWALALVELAGISLEIAQMAITPEDGETLPAWFIVEVTRDLPALTKKKMG